MSQPSSWLVLKFGGTSVSRPEYWELIARRVQSAQQQGRKALVVVSALSQVTNRLQQCVAGSQRLAALLEEIHAQHQTIFQAFSLQPAQAWTTQWTSLEQALSMKISDASQQAHVLAKGELLSSLMGAQILCHLGCDTAWLDSRAYLIAEQAANPLCVDVAVQPDAAFVQVCEELGGALIAPGYVASDVDGNTVLLGRGGSDTSGAYFAALLGAEELQIWTDVPGLFTTNPRQVPSARLLKLLGYQEAQELASMGAKVLHPRCLLPARKWQIPLHIRCTASPAMQGTEISAHARDFGAQIKAIVQRRGLTVIVLEGLEMWQEVGFLAKVFACFDRAGLSVDLISTSESNVTVTLDTDALAISTDAIQRVVEDLMQYCEVSVVQHAASVSLVGNGIRTILHKLGPALEVFEQRRIYLVSQAANDLNLSFVVDDKDADKLVQQLHQQLIPGGLGADSVFGHTFSQLFGTGPVPERRPLWWQLDAQTLLDAFADRDACYAYHLPTIAENCQRLKRINAVDQFWHACKANDQPQILKQVFDAGLGLECVSLQEVRHVQQHLPTCPPQRILFTPNFAPRAEYVAALQEGIHVTVDNMYCLQHWAGSFAGKQILLRVDPGSGLGHHKMVRTAGSNSKFGIPMNCLPEAMQICADHNIGIKGLHAHTGSGIMTPDNWQRTLTILLEFSAQLPDCQVINIGGGLGIPDKPDDLPLDTGALNQALMALRNETDRKFTLWMEPGRYVVAEAGVLLARVTQTKQKADIHYVGVATGMNALIRPALYGSYHQIANLTRLDRPATDIVNVVGPICETGDTLGTDRVLPATQEGDVLLIANTGAYGAVMASAYNRRTLPDALVLQK